MKKTEFLLLLVSKLFVYCHFWLFFTGIGNVVGNHSVLASISELQHTQNEFKFHTVYSGISEQIKHLQLVGQVPDFKFESKFESLPVIWQSLPMTIPEENQRIWLQSPWLSSWEHTQAQLGLVKTVKKGFSSCSGFFSCSDFHRSLGVWWYCLVHYWISR